MHMMQSSSESIHLNGKSLEIYFELALDHMPVLSVRCTCSQTSKPPRRPSHIQCSKAEFDLKPFDAEIERDDTSPGHPAPVSVPTLVLYRVTRIHSGSSVKITHCVGIGKITRTLLACCTVTQPAMEVTCDKTMNCRSFGEPGHFVATSKQ